MKKINNIYLATEKDGSIEKNMAELPENPGGYSAIFTSLDPKFAEKVLKSLSETEESVHPAMFIPLAFIFQHPPFKVSEDLRKETGGKSLLQRMIADFLEHTQEWLYANGPLTMELLELCPNLQKDRLDKQQTAIRNIHITPDIEKTYLERAKDRQDTIKRTKILAALNALLTHQLLSDAVNKEKAVEAAEYMFLFTRSMAQFAANKAVEDGLTRQDNRRKGGEREADRTGLLALVKRYHEKNPQVTNSELWKLIKKDLLQRKNVKPCKGYSVRFYDEHTDISDSSGLLIQKKSKGKEYSIGFEAFRNIRSEVRK